MGTFVALLGFVGTFGGIILIILAILMPYYVHLTAYRLGRVNKQLAEIMNLLTKQFQGQEVQKIAEIAAIEAHLSKPPEIEALPDIDAIWWIGLPGKDARGPYSEASIRRGLASGKLSPSYLCSRTNDSEWHPLGHFFQ